MSFLMRGGKKTQKMYFREILGVQMPADCDEHQPLQCSQDQRSSSGTQIIQVSLRNKTRVTVTAIKQ